MFFYGKIYYLCFCLYVVDLLLYCVILRKMKQFGKCNEGKRVEIRKDECNFEMRLIEKVIKVNFEFLKLFYVYWFFV